MVRGLGHYVVWAGGECLLADYCYCDAKYDHEPGEEIWVYPRYSTYPRKKKLLDRFRK